MRVVLQERVGVPPLAVNNVGHLAVYNESDELIAIMWRNEDDTISLTRSGEADFEKLVAQMALDKRAEVRCVSL